MRASLRAPSNEITGSVGDNYILLKVRTTEQPFWKPQLNMSLEEDKNGTTISGLYGPRQDIWMLFMGLYFLCGFLTMVVLIIGLSRYNLGLSAYILWAVPFTLGGIFVLWLSDRIGRRLGREQIQKIHQFVEQNLFQSVLSDA